MTDFLWLFLALLGTLTLILPTGIRAGIWSAPLESSAAYIWLVAWWVSCALRIKSGRTGKGVWIFFIFLATAKISFFAFTPQQGLWARFYTSGLVSWVGAPLPPAIEKTTPPRPQKPDGWELHRSAFILPHFINDHRRFNYYNEQPLKRFSLPYRLELQGWLLLPEGGMLVAPEGGVLLIDDIPATHAMSARTINPSERIVKIDYAINTKTEFPEKDRLLLNVNGQNTRVEEWRFWAEKPRLTSPIALRLIFLCGRIWNLGMSLLLLSVLSPLIKKMWRILKPYGVVKWLPFTGFILAAIMPIQKDSSLIFRTAGMFILLFTTLYLFLRSLEKLKSHNWSFLADLSNTATDWLIIGFCVIIWSIMGSRFFDSRFTGGFAILPAGMDTLFHYTYAREILSGDWFHLADAPFTRQPFIRYLLLIPLFVEGEGATWGFHVHWTLFALTGVILWASLKPLSLARAWLIFAIWFLAFPLNDNSVFVPTLFPEIWATLFLVLSYYFIAKTADREKDVTKLFIIGGILLGLGVWTRNNFLALFPLWAGLIILHHAKRRGMKKGMAYGLVFSAAVILTVSVVTLRNTLLTPNAPFSLLMTPERSSTDLFQGFQLKEITAGEIRERPFLSRFNLPTARFIEGVRRRPGLFLASQIDRLLILFGLPAFTEENLVKNYPKLNIWHLFLWALILLKALRYGWRSLSGYRECLCWAVIVAHVGLIFFTGYLPARYRVILPVYPFMLLIGILASNHKIKHEEA
jgi:hypothetical protein